MGVVMPSLHIEYENCSVVSLLLSTLDEQPQAILVQAFNRKNNLNDKVENFFKKIFSLMDVSINLKGK